MPVNDSAPGPDSDVAPTGILVASTLCWLVGILTILIDLAVGIPKVTGAGRVRFAILASAIAGVVACTAGYLVRKRRKSGALLLVFAWAIPAVVGLLSDGVARAGNPLLFIAMLSVFWNWKHLS